MDDIYRNIEEYNPEKEHKILILFDDNIADMLSRVSGNPEKLSNHSLRTNYLFQVFWDKLKILTLNLLGTYSWCHHFRFHNIKFKPPTIP